LREGALEILDRRVGIPLRGIWLKIMMRLIGGGDVESIWDRREPLEVYLRMGIFFGFFRMI
jgi:hypothetical protein